MLIKPIMIPLKISINNNLGNMYCFEKKQYEKGIKLL